MLYITLGGYCCDIIVLNVYAPVDKTDDTKDSLFKKLEHVFDQFLKYNIKILLGDLDVKVGKEDIFKPTVRNIITFISTLGLLLMGKQPD
jgi:hypothetical protein